MLLAVLFRQAELAIGLGLAHLLVIEGLIFSLMRNAHNSGLDAVEKFFPGPNVAALIASFGSSVPGAASRPPLVGGAQAVLVLGAFIAGATIVSGLLLRRQDVL